MNRELLKRLTQADAVAGNEGEVRKVILADCRAYADEVMTDGLGSLILHHKGMGKKIMLAAHMDEVGFLIRSVSDMGLCSVMPLGGVKPYARTDQPVVITTRNNKKVYGFLQSVYQNEKAENTYVDCGMDSKQEVLDAGIRPGDMVTFASEGHDCSENRFMAKALDDRTGCEVLAEVLKQYQGDLDVYYCFTSSEEVGTRGSATCADLIRPDAAIVVDVACWHSEWDRGFQNNRQLGKGVMLVLYDKTCVANRAFAVIAETEAKSGGIGIQPDMFSGGGTDAGSIHLRNGGTPVLTLGIPLRYCHTSMSFCDLRDLAACEKLIGMVLHDLEENGLERLSYADEL